MVSATSIFNSAQFNEGEVSIPAWSEEAIRIRELSAKQANEVIKLVGTDDLRSNALAVAYGCLNDDGKRIFNDKQIDNILEKLRVQDIATAAQAIMELSQVDAEEK